MAELKTIMDPAVGMFEAVVFNDYHYLGANI
jgi:hypothetical protein